MIYEINKQSLIEEASVKKLVERALTKAVVVSKVRDNPSNLKKLMKGLANSDNIGTPKKTKTTGTKENKIINFDKQTISSISDTARKIIKEKTKKEPETQKPKYKKLDILV